MFFFVISVFLDKSIFDMNIHIITSIFDMKVLTFLMKELSKSVQIDESLCCVCIIKQLRKQQSAGLA